MSRFLFKIYFQKCSFVSNVLKCFKWSEGMTWLIWCQAPSLWGRGTFPALGLPATHDVRCTCIRVWYFLVNFEGNCRAFKLVLKLPTMFSRSELMVVFMHWCNCILENGLTWKTLLGLWKPPFSALGLPATHEVCRWLVTVSSQGCTWWDSLTFSFNCVCWVDWTRVTCVIGVCTTLPNLNLMISAFVRAVCELLGR